MAVTLEAVLEQVRQLPVEEQTQLRALLPATNGTAPQAKSPLAAEGESFAPTHPMSSPERRWLRQHSHEYPGEFLAVEGDQLIAHGTDAKAVFAAARAAGVEYPMFVRVDPVESPNAPAWLMAGRARPARTPMNDRTEEYQWLAQHRHEYPGELLALKGSHLIAHGVDDKEVFAAVRAAGVEDAYFVHVQPADALPFAGW